MIYLMRHGQDDEKYIGGWSDVSLLPLGVEQVTESALWIKDNLHIEKIICSDVNRAIESAKIVANLLGMDYDVSDVLREQNKGLLNGVLREEADVISPGYRKRGVDFVYPKGESLEMLFKRVETFLENIDEIPDNTLLITHRGFINAIYYICNNKKLDMNKKQFGVVPASVHEFDYKEMTIKKVR